MADATNPPERTWCEHCQDHFPEDHYDANDNHKAGAKYGPTGAEMAALAGLRELLDLLEPLMDPEFCTPFPSAWELDPDNGVSQLDGKQLHGRIKAVYERLRGQADA